MSSVDMKDSYDYDNMEERKDIIGDQTPYRSFYNIIDLDNSPNNIIERINCELTYNKFQEIMEKYSIVAIGPMVFDHDMIPQITFISDDHDCSFHRNGDVFYPPVVYQLKNKEVVPETNHREQPIYYYSGVFIFRGIDVHLICHHISNYLFDNCNQYHEDSDIFRAIVDNSFMEYTINDQIQSKTIYNVEQSTLRENTTLIKMIDALFDGKEYGYDTRPSTEMLQIFEMIKKNFENNDNDDGEFTVNLSEKVQNIIRHKIWKLMITDDMEEDYGITNFAVKSLKFDQMKTYADILIFSTENKKIMMEFKKDDVSLDIKFFIFSDESMNFPNLLCKETFDIIADRNIIQLRSERLEKKLSKYYDLSKFFGFMTKFFGMINDTQSMFYFGNQIKKTGRRRDRTNKDDRDDDREVKDRYADVQSDDLPVDQD